MKRWLIILLLASSCAYGRSPEDDRLIHGSVSFGVSLTTMLLLKKTGMSNTSATILGTLLTMGVGLAKEYNDVAFDNRDIGSNAIGCASSLLLNLTFDF